MDFENFDVQKDDDGRRLDKIIKVLFPNKGLAEINALIRKKLVRLNDKKASNDTRVSEGDKISIATFLFDSLPQSEHTDKESEKQTTATKINLDVLFQNVHFIIINKPYNTTVHGFQDSLDVQVKELYNSVTDKKSLSFKPGPLHRLDKKTTGILAFSWSLSGAQWFSENIAKHSIEKFYTGVILGKLMKKETWENSIQKIDDSEDSFHTVTESENGKKALTYVTPLKYGKYKGKDITLAQFHIVTGRTHQIRFQSAQNGYVLLGDTAYSSFPIKEKQDFFLHATKLTIPNNSLGLPDEITCPLNRDFEDFCKKYF